MVVKRTDGSSNIQANKDQVEGTSKTSNKKEVTKKPSVIDQLVDLQKAEGSLNKVLSGDNSDGGAIHEDSDQHADHSDQICK